MPGSANDSVVFDNILTSSATLDVPLGNPLQSLQFTGWSGFGISTRLTFNNVLTVYGGTFNLADGSTIILGANVPLAIQEMNNATWTSGTITGGANSQFTVAGTALTVLAPASGTGSATLGTNLVVEQSPQKNSQGLYPPGDLFLVGMTNNLVMNGTSNFIDVQNGGTLGLSQWIAANGQQNTQGGIGFAAAHTGKLAVEVEAGGTLNRGGGSPQGVSSQVSIAGAVYNYGGTVSVGSGTMLNITGVDSNGYSYWQQGSPAGTVGVTASADGGTTGSGAMLQIGSGGNINAAGSYEIDQGTVQFTAPSGGSADELDGVALNFGTGDGQSASLTIVDSTFGTCGTVTVQAAVILALSTATTMNFNGGNNTADLLDVKNAPLTLNGTLKLVSNDSMKPTQPLNFFDESGTSPPPLTSSFWAITDDVGGSDSGAAVTNNPQLIYYQITIT